MKYKVVIDVVGSCLVEVEADNFDDAEEKSMQAFNTQHGNYKDMWFYEVNPAEITDENDNTKCIVY